MRAIEHVAYPTGGGPLVSSPHDVGRATYATKGLRRHGRRRQPEGARGRADRILNTGGAISRYSVRASGFMVDDDKGHGQGVRQKGSGGGDVALDRSSQRMRRW